MHHRTGLLSFSLLIYLSATAADDPPFPKLRDIASSFESSAEISERIQNTSGLAKEYYDFDDQTGRLEFMAFGLKKTYFFYGKPDMDQVYMVNDTSCTESDGGVAELSFPFYGWTSFKPAYVGPSALIMMKENDPPDFINGISTVRGIQCNWFHSETSKNGKNVTLDYYFSVSDWDMPWNSGKNKKSFPIRIIVSYYSDKEAPQEYVVDFLYFRPKVVDKSKFQPPVGLGCTLKKDTVKLPVIPNQYTFSAEVFDLLHDQKHAETDVVSAIVWYDYKYKYARMDKYTSMGKVSDLFDFNTGVMYHMHDDRTCVFKTMRNSFFLKFGADSLVGSMKDPYEVLNLQGDVETFYKMGQAEVRGMKCNVIEKVEHDISFFDVRYKKLVTTVYISTDSTKIQVDGEDLDFSPPVEIIITGYKDETTVTLNKQFQIFSFDDEPGRRFFATYPSEQCFPASNQKSYFVISLESPKNISAEAESEDVEFDLFAKAKIINVANITEFRLPYLRTDYRASGIYIQGLILDKPPVLKQFWKLADEPQFVTTMSAYEIDIDDADEESCAAACVGYSEPCKGFHFCGQGCFLNLGEITDEPVDNIPLDLECYVYMRAVTESNNNQATLKQALDKLEAAVNAKKLSFTVRIKGETGTLDAIDFVGSLNSRGGDDVSSYPYTLVKSGFQFKGDLETTLEVPDALSEDECYRQCKESTAISCASFSYCAKASNKMCRITSVLLEDGPKDINEIDPNVKCDIFSLLYLDFFDRYPGRVVVIPGEKSVTDAYNTESCAKACKEETDFKCRGFEYCKSKNTCVLHSKHVMDLKPEETLPSTAKCTHYAAKFIADYRDMGLLLIDDESNRRVDMSLEECARACSEEVPSCNSFNYCPSSVTGVADSSCSMTSETLYGSAKTKTLGKCHLYTKRENVEDWKNLPRKAGAKDGYTRSGFAGLLIGMIILGLVIGALMFVGYSFFRSRTGGGDGLTVKFSKQDNL